MCQGFSHFLGFLLNFVLAKLATSIRVHVNACTENIYNFRVPLVVETWDRDRQRSTDSLQGVSQIPLAKLLAASKGRIMVSHNMYQAKYCIIRILYSWLIWRGL